MVIQGQNPFECHFPPIFTAFLHVFGFVALKNTLPVCLHWAFLSAPPLCSPGPFPRGSDTCRGHQRAWRPPWLCWTLAVGEATWAPGSGCVWRDGGAQAGLARGLCVASQDSWHHTWQENSIFDSLIPPLGIFPNGTECPLHSSGYLCVNFLSFFVFSCIFQMVCNLHGLLL